MKDAYWNAVQNADTTGVAQMLDDSSSLVDERYAGQAWIPRHVYDPVEQKQIPAPSDFPFTNTASHSAAINARTELVELLLRHGQTATVPHTSTNSLATLGSTRSILLHFDTMMKRHWSVWLRHSDWHFFPTARRCPHLPTPFVTRLTGFHFKMLLRFTRTRTTTLNTSQISG